MGDARLDQLNIVVEDMDAAVAFYRRLGFTVGDTDPEWMPHHRNATSPDGIDIDLDSTAFARRWGDVGAGVVVGVRLPSRAAVDDRYAELIGDGHASVRAPYDAFWGARYAIVRDPGGNAVGLMSPADPALRSSSPDPPF